MTFRNMRIVTLSKQFKESSCFVTSNCGQMRSQWNFDWPSKIIVHMKHFFGDGDTNF